MISIKLQNNNFQKSIKFKFGLWNTYDIETWWILKRTVEFPIFLYLEKLWRVTQIVWF